MRKKSSLGKGINSIEGNSWVFNKNVAISFDKHVRQSIPFYDLIQKYITSISEWFIKDHSIIYDLGCSTGILLNKLAKRNNKQINFFGIDTVKNMIVQAKKENKIRKNTNNIKYINGDILKTKFKKSDLITSYYTIQFMHPGVRQKIIDKILSL